MFSLWSIDGFVNSPNSLRHALMNLNARLTVSQLQPLAHLTFFDIFDLSGAGPGNEGCPAWAWAWVLYSCFCQSAFNYAENHKMLLEQHFSFPIREILTYAWKNVPRRGFATSPQLALQLGLAVPAGALRCLTL